MKRFDNIYFGCHISPLRTFSSLGNLTRCSSLIILLILLPTSSSYSYGIGFCPRVFGMSDFNMTKVKIVQNLHLEKTYKCSNIKVE